MEWDYVSNKRLKENLAQTILDIVRENLTVPSSLGNSKEEIYGAIKGMTKLYSRIVEEMEQEAKQDAADT